MQKNLMQFYTFQKTDHHLYLGDIIAANDLQTLKNKNIKFVISLLDSKYHFDYLEDQCISHLNITIKDIPSEKISDHFQKCYSFIEENSKKGSGLIHCMAGISRSSTICIAYMMRKQLLKFQKSYNLLKGIKQDIMPNYGFIRQLKQYDKFIKELREKHTDELLNKILNIQ